MIGLFLLLYHTEPPIYFFVHLSKVMTGTLPLACWLDEHYTILNKSQACRVFSDVIKCIHSCQNGTEQGDPARVIILL